MDTYKKIFHWICSRLQSSGCIMLLKCFYVFKKWFVIKEQDLASGYRIYDNMIIKHTGLTHTHILAYYQIRCILNK